MGKTHKGSVWLDPELTPPYDYYQYWINQDDRDVERFLALFTFLSMEEVRKLGSLKGADIRQAKEALAYETTKLCHGEQEAEKARIASQQLFGGNRSEFAESVPSYSIDSGEIEKGIPAYLLFEKTNLCASRGEARRLISQGGGYINNKRVKNFNQIVDLKDIINDSILLRTGKKKYLRIITE